MANSNEDAIKILKDIIRKCHPDARPAMGYDLRNIEGLARDCMNVLLGQSQEEFPRCHPSGSLGITVTVEIK